jgi:replication-associated recombination protein RarA
MSELIDNSLWVERYRPQSLDTYIGNENVIAKCKQFIEEQDIPHLLFWGRAGGGKCLDFEELIDIEIELSDAEYEILKKYELK